MTPPSEVQAGEPPVKPGTPYRNVRIEGRGLIEVDPEESVKIKTIYLWYAYANLTIDGIVERLAKECITYCPSVPKLTPSKVHTILRDRAYIGEEVPEDVAEWVSRILRARVQDRQKGAREKAAAIQKQMDGLRGQEDRLLNMRLLGEIEGDTYAAKSTELRDRVSALKLQLDACDRGSDENADLAAKTFELSQRFAEKWLTADSASKRQILEMICLNLKLEGVSLVPEWRKPFDLLAEGLFLKNNRGDRI